VENHPFKRRFPEPIFRFTRARISAKGTRDLAPDQRQDIFQVILAAVNCGEVRTTLVTVNPATLSRECVKEIAEFVISQPVSPP
jgi:hypothetical protein